MRTSNYLVDVILECYAAVNKYSEILDHISPLEWLTVYGISMMRGVLSRFTTERDDFTFLYVQRHHVAVTPLLDTMKILFKYLCLIRRGHVPIKLHIVCVHEKTAVFEDVTEVVDKNCKEQWT